MGKNSEVRIHAPTRNLENLVRAYEGKTEDSPFDSPETLTGHTYNPAGEVVGLWRLCAVIRRINVKRK